MRNAREPVFAASRTVVGGPRPRAKPPEVGALFRAGGVSGDDAPPPHGGDRTAASRATVVPAAGARVGGRRVRDAAATALVVEGPVAGRVGCLRQQTAS